MATVKVDIDADDYTLLSTSDDALIQNVGSDSIRVSFAASEPVAGVDTFHILGPNEVLQKINTVPAGNIYARTIKASSTGIVQVS